MPDLRERNMNEYERAPNPSEATDIVDELAKTLIRNQGFDVGDLHLYAAYRPKNIETGYEPDLVLYFTDGKRGNNKKDVRVELDLRIHNPR